MGDANHSHEKIPSSPNTNVEKYDEIMIDLTTDRIEQEINNIASAETKSGVIFGFASAIIGIVFGVSDYEDFLFNFQKEIWHIVITWLPMIFLAISIACSVPILFIRSRLRLVDPRATNDDYVNLSILELKQTLKKELIENFEFMEEKRKHDWLLLNIAFSTLLSGSVTIFITLILIKNDVL